MKVDRSEFQRQSCQLLISLGQGVNANDSQVSNFSDRIIIPWRDGGAVESEVTMALDTEQTLCQYWGPSSFSTASNSGPSFPSLQKSQGFRAQDLVPGQRGAEPEEGSQPISTAPPESKLGGRGPLSQREGGLRSCAEVPSFLMEQDLIKKKKKQSKTGFKITAT